MRSDFASPFSVEQDQVRRELTVSDAASCAEHVKRRVMADFLSKQRPLEVLIREWMIENVQGTPTTRTDFETTVRWLLDPASD